VISLARAHLLIIGLTALNYAAMLVYSIPKLLSATDGLWPFDLRIMGYSVEDATLYVTTITNEGRLFYLEVQQMLDTFFPALLAISLMLTLYRLAPKLPVLYLFPISGALFDYYENAAVAQILLTNTPDQGLVEMASLLTGLKALTLPAIALALPQASILARVMRSALLDTLSEDFIRTARAKGLTRQQALWRHALRNAMIPVLTIIGLQFSFLLAGAIIIENVFFLPGLGRLVFQSISQRDLIVVESVVMLLVFAVVAVNFAVDMAYGAVDPRLRGRA